MALPDPIINTSVSVSTTQSTTSGTYELIPGLTVTPTSGVYIVWLSGTLRNSAPNGLTNTAIFVGGAQILHTQRTMEGTDKVPAAAQCVVSVNGSQAIEGRFKKAGNNTGEFHEGALSILRLGDVAS